MDVLSRWLHITAAAVAVGGLIYARFVLMPAMESLAAEQRAALAAQIAKRLRPIASAAIVLVVVSGVYNLIRVLEQGVTSSYHMAFGIKFLIAGHVLAMLYVASTPPSGDAARDAKRPRLLLGGAISGLVVLALGAYLRSLRG